MYDLGSLISTKYLPEEMAMINRKIDSGLDPDASATEVLGMTLQQVGAEVAKRWKLPISIISIIDGTGDPVLVDIAKFSSTASSLIHEGKVDEVNKLVSAFDVPGTDKSKMTVLINRKVVEITPKARGRQPVLPEVKLAELFSVLTEDKKGTVEELAGAMFTELSNSLNTAHCLFFMLTRTGEYHVRYGYGKGIDELRSKLKIPAKLKPTAFHAVIKNNIDVSIADVSKLKATALPDGYHALLPNVNKFIILPIANSGVAGLLYLDWENDKELSPPELAAVRRLRDLFLPFFRRS